MLAVTLSFFGPTTVAALSGRLDAAGAPLFDKELAGLDALPQTLVIDFSEVEYLSSAGLRSLISVAKKMKPQGGEIRLCGLKPFLFKVLELSGLSHFFKITETLEQACAEAACTAAALETQLALEIEDRTLLLRIAPGGASTLELWSGATRNAGAPWRASELIQTTLEELGLGLGLAGFGATREQALPGLGPVLTGWGVAGLLGKSAGDEADFVTTGRPEETTLFLAQALAVSGPAQATVTVRSRHGFTLAQVLSELAPHLPAPVSQAFPQERPRAFVVLGQGLREDGAATGKDVFLFCLSLPETPELAEFKRLDLPWIDREGRAWIAFGLVLEPAAALPEPEPDNLRQALGKVCALDALLDARAFSAETRLDAASIWAFAPESVRAGHEKRLRIELAGDGQIRDEWDHIIRRIYASDAGSPSAGAARVVLTPLAGGFSSQNYYVDSFDRDGKRLIPTVLKLGKLALIQREEEAYVRYVKPFILNNSTTIMGSAEHGEWAGLRYNFVGVSGPGSSLRWLTKHYQTRPAEELIPLFDRIFTNILKPWYGQPRWEAIHPYADHDPTKLFSSIFADAAKELGVDADAPTIDFPELGRALPNPYRFLKEEFPKRAGQTQLWYTSVTHNDLNMQNILIDERENAYIIDFSETRNKNVTADFARLEPIFLLEMTDVEDEKNRVELARFMERWYASATYDAFPELVYQGSDPMVPKAYQLMRRLRRYADVCTLFETDLAPYLLAALEWTICVVSYWGVSVERKRLSALMSALICEQLLKKDR
jgi:anti-anti-sigma factor